MSNVKKGLVLVVMAAVLAACAPAETMPDSPTVASEATEALEEVLVSPSSTPVLERPAGAQSPAPTAVPTKLFLEIAPDADTKPTPELEVIPMPQRPPADPPTDPYALELIDKAKNDLAERKGIAKEEIALVDFRLVTWPDASLGCPKPGMEYAQVLVDGYFIMLRIGLDINNYHGGGYPDSEPFLCERTSRDITIPPPARSPDL